MSSSSGDEEEVVASSSSAAAMANYEDEEAIELDDEELEEDSDEEDNLMEPQVILQNDNPDCPLCQGPLSSHYQGQPCGTTSFDGSNSGHFLFEGSSSQSCSKPRCVVCSAKNPTREHLANHFINELIESLEDEQQCSKCDFQSSAPKQLALHDVTEHEGDSLNKLLEDAALVSSKKAEVEAKGHRQSLGPQCPICDQQMHRSHGRDHVSWHFVDELREMISDPVRCPECSYVGDKLEAVTRHLALFHCKLDEFLQDEQLVASKRAKALSKPKKVSIGPKCPICDIKDPAREHVSRHFMNELMEFIADLDDQLQCPECSYRGEKSQNVARHIALVHSRLDALLADEELVARRKQEYLMKPNKINIGAECPVCDQQLTKQHSRVHVIWHFMDELREIVQTFAEPTRCDFCTYMNVNSDKVVKHIALGHSKLDEMLQDEELVQRKRALASTKPKKESIGPVCPICDVRDPPREHVARHFGDELNDLISDLEDQLSCSECSYKGEKPKNLALHIALVHGRLDTFIKDKNLVRAKRAQFQSQPKKQILGPRCPVCDMVFTKSQNRDHVAWHFIDELREFVQTFDDPHKCWKCDYRSEKMDNLVKHVALGHSKLDELLQNRALLIEKRAKVLSKPRRVAIGPTCPICDAKDPAREHVARHFSDELLAIVNQYPDPYACMECDYRGDKPKTVSIHVGLVHAKLDVMLQDQDLVNQKRAIFHSKPKKLSIGPTCPVCDLKFTKTQNRDHVSWHYIDELRAIVNEFDDPNQCPQCPYSGDTNEKMVKHVALGHSMLDALLADEALLEHKRMKALNKPKKVQVGSTCPICDTKDPSREHVSRHFSDELLDIVMGFEDPNQCTQCSYKSDKPKNVSIHIALVHSILDHFLSDQELVKSKRDSYALKPQKINIGNQCPICDVEFAKGQNRDHVCWHFMDELRDIVLAFPDTNMCNECSYSSDKLDNLVKHVALGHSKLDELLSNDELVAQKRELALNKPKKIQIGPNCPICDMKFTKAQNRDHVSWHFIDELREFVHSTGSDRACQLCYYTTEKMDNLVKHYALGHSKMDEYLADDELVEKKREEHAKKPKRLSFGPDCPICQEKNRDRDHVSRHFMNELMEIVNEMPNKKKCNMCSYKSNKREYMAKHIALFHCKLDELMADEALVQLKQKKAAAKPKRVPLGENCPICGISFPQREHVCRHFMDELLAMINEFDNPLSCAHCPFTADRAEYVARHVGLVHRKLDEMLCDSELVARKTSEFNGAPSIPVKVEPIRKSSRQAKPIVKDSEEVAPKPGKRKSSTDAAVKVEVDEDESSSAEPASKVVKVSSSPGEDDSMMTYDYDSASNQSFTCKDEPLDEQSLPSPPKVPKVTIEKASTPKATKVEGPKVSLLKSTLLKPQAPALKMPPLSSLLKQPLTPKIPGNILMNSLLKPSVTVQPVASFKKEPISLPPSISLTPKVKASISPVKLDSYSIADLNNSWAESLMKDNGNCSSPLGTLTLTKKDSAKNDGGHHKTIGSCTLTPATGNPKVTIQTSSSGPTVSLQKISKSSPAVPSVTLTPADPKVKAKRIKWNITPTATITPVRKLQGTPNLKPMFPSKPLEKAELASFGLSDKLGKPLVGAEHVVVTPELPGHHDEDEDMDEDEDDGENMVLEPQIFLDDEDDESDNNNGEEYDEANNGSLNESIDEDLDHEDDEEEEFCDLCSMELEHHPDNQPCPPDEGYTRQFKSCPICKTSEPTREHVAKHFLRELKAVVEGFDDPLSCTKCDYQSEKTSETVALHIALNHDALEPYLRNVKGPKIAVSSVNKSPSAGETKKYVLGSTCPICQFKDPSREHVSRHFMNELLDHVATLQDHLQCHQCSYRGEKPQNLAKHIALVHNKLDEFLLNSEMVQHKHEEAMAKPKKISIGSTCPVCLQAIQKRDSRVHVIWHFMEELREMVQEFPDTTMCNYCPYTNPNPDKMAKHMALGHSKLDELLSNHELVMIKQQKALSKPKKLSIGPECPICGMQFTKSQNRDHVSWHFMDELREYVQTFEDQQQCNQCEYRSDKVDNLVKHLALGHSKLDELLLNEELVAAKKELARSKPKKVSIGPTCPICDMAFTKSQNRDHVSWHFMEELRAIVNNEFEDPQVCNQCDYQTDKMDNLVKHLALGHSKLDEFLMDDQLVASKRFQYHNGGGGSTSSGRK